MADETARLNTNLFGSWRGIRLVLLAWLAMLGFDFFLHGGLLAGFYTRSSPFLLPAEQAFRRIPIGYLSFLISAAFLVWLMAALDVRRWGRGLVVGAGVGAVIWISFGLGMYSITTADARLLVAWSVGQTVEMAYAGALVGYGTQRGSLRRPFVIAVASSIFLAALTVVLQSLGMASAVIVH